MSKVFDAAGELGGRADRRMREELLGWLVTVGADGTPQPNAVWFHWDGETVLVYSQPGRPKLAHIARNPRVAFHLDSRSDGDDIVVVTGEAAVDEAAPGLHQIPQYVAKYREHMTRLGLGTPDEMAASYSVAIRITPTRLRGY